MSLALLAILKAVRSYKDERLAFARYARLVISREVVSAARKSARGPKRGDFTYGDELAEIDEYVPDERAAPDVSGTAIANLDEIMAQLSEVEQIILVKRIEGDSESAIARELGFSRLKVREHMRRIREVGHQVLGEVEDDSL